MGILIAYLLGVLTASKSKNHHARHHTDSRPLSAMCVPPTKSVEELAEEEKKKSRETIKFRVELFGAFVLFVYTTFTILMWCANKKAADAAKSAADTAQKQLCDSEETQRANLYVEPAWDEKTKEITYTVTNIGHSTATGITFASGSDTGSLKELFPSMPPQGAFESKIIPQPSSLTGLAPLEAGKSFPVLGNGAVAEAWSSQKVYVFQYVSIGFKDIFGIDRHAYGCMYYNRVPHGYTKCVVASFDKAEYAKSCHGKQ